MTQQVKVVGSNGQLSLGKAFAGQMILIDQIDEGTWIIKSGVFIPDTEKWLHEEAHSNKLDKALTWASQHKPIDNLDEIAQGIENELD